MRFIYLYDDGNKKIHSKYISKKTILKEKGNSSFVAIYQERKKCNMERVGYITTLILH